MAYLYRHIRLDKNEPFYIGIGSDSNYNRAYEIKKDRRNIVWSRIASKSEIEVEIMLDGLSWDNACEKEIEFIKLYGRIDNGNGILSNLTDGGDGTLGLIVSEKTRKENSERFSGKGNPMYNKSHSKELIEQIRLKNIGKVAWNKGLKTGANIKLSKAKKGCVPWNKGLKNVNGVSLSKLVLNLQNGVYYQSCKEASFVYGYKHSTLKSMLNGTNKNKTSLTYI
tara:strand:+ start:280 stop:951 length:672 start_codon:yes stop_codon:yes gene_type:complete